MKTTTCDRCGKSGPYEEGPPTWYYLHSPDMDLCEPCYYIFLKRSKAFHDSFLSECIGICGAKTANI